MRDILFDKFKEAIQSILPVTLIVFILHFTLAPMPMGTLVLFLSGTVLLVIGMTIFTLGADTAMMPMGEIIGSEITKSRNVWFMIISGFILGVVVTSAEPDLQVLTKQVPAVPDMTLVLAVAVGVGIFLVIALLRILLQIKISYIFMVSYLLVFALAAFIAPDFLPVAFDSGGVTTGPITVPFILALGSGVSAVRGSKKAEQDSFGLCALCSVGPILAVLILGLFYDSSSKGFAFETVQGVANAKELFILYGQALLQFFKEVCMVLLPIVVIFCIFQLVKKRLTSTALIRIGVGILYTLVGLSIFLTAVNIGFMPVGNYLGKTIASMPNNWILLPLGALIGFAVVYAEPAVHVLNKQVEDITNGSISKKMMMAGLSSGVAVALVLAMIRVLTGISIWYFLLPGYLLALILTLVSPEIFTAIAFDSGGVAAGTMAAAFLLPFAVGVCDAVGGNPMTDAFGIIAMVAMMPLVTIQIMGFIYQMKLRRAEQVEQKLQLAIAEDTTIIDENIELDNLEETELCDQAAPAPVLDDTEDAGAPNVKEEDPECHN